jgi:hypothetical protein
VVVALVDLPVVAHLIRLYILPTLGAMLASKLDTELLERFCARLHNPQRETPIRPHHEHQATTPSQAATDPIFSPARASRQGCLSTPIRVTWLGQG